MNKKIRQIYLKILKMLNLEDESLFYIAGSDKLPPPLGEEEEAKLLKKLMEKDSNAKNINSMLVSRMFNVKSKLAETEEFQKANIIPKTIRIEKNGRIKEYGTKLITQDMKA